MIYHTGQIPGPKAVVDIHHADPAGAGVQHGQQRRQAPNKAKTATRTPKGGPVDFSQMQGGFAQFFGFDPRTGQVVDEEKVSGQKKNPLDATDLFERFMGFK